jgi:hypothetical protein
MIGPFEGKYRFLSNFSKGIVTLDGILYLYREQAYQAGKLRSNKAKLWISNLEGPLEAKHACRLEGKNRAKGLPSEFLDDLITQEEWLPISLKHMHKVVFEFFFQNAFSRKFLLDTGNEELVELNHWHDCFWGKCTCPMHKGVGENHLGKILMDVRMRLKEENLKRLGDQLKDAQATEALKNFIGPKATRLLEKK